MRGVRSRRGRSSTTRSARTAVWDTARRKSLRRRMQQASTRLSERQGIQTPSLAPRAPPSRLKPKMEQQKVVVFLRERKQGAGHLAIENRGQHSLTGVSVTLYNTGLWMQFSHN